MTIKSVIMKISKNKKICFFLMSQGSLDPKIWFLGQKVCSVAHVQTDRLTRRHTDRQTDKQTDTKVNTEDTLSGFHEFFLQPIIKKQYNKEKRKQAQRRAAEGRSRYEVLQYQGPYFPTQYPKWITSPLS